MSTATKIRIRPITVGEKAFEKYRMVREECIKGVGKMADGKIAVEMLSESTRKRFVTLYDPDSGEAYHYCPAVEKNNHCWHLAALIDMFQSGESGAEIVVNMDNAIGKVEVVEDLSSTYLGRSGSFEYVRYKPTLGVVTGGAAKKTEPAPAATTEAPKEEEPAVTKTRGARKKVTTSTGETATGDAGYTSSKEHFSGPAGDFTVEVLESVHAKWLDDAWVKKLPIPDNTLKSLLAFRAEQRSKLTAEQLKRIPFDVDYYIDGPAFTDAIKAMFYQKGARWQPILFYGPASTGKSTIAKFLCKVALLPANTINGCVDQNTDKLLGAKTVVSDEESGVDIYTEAQIRKACKAVDMDPTPILTKLRQTTNRIVFETGVIVDALVNGEAIIVEEINMMLPDVLAIFNALLDWQRSLTITGYGRVEVSPSTRFFANMNIGYEGCKELNQAFEDRFEAIAIDYLPVEKTAEMYQKNFGCYEEMALRMARAFHAVAEAALKHEPGILEKFVSHRKFERAIYAIRDDGYLTLPQQVEILARKVAGTCTDDFSTKQLYALLETAYMRAV